MEYYIPNNNNRKSICENMLQFTCLETACVAKLTKTRNLVQQMIANRE